MEIEKIKITDIKPAEYNPRQITSEELTKLTNSISTFGLVDPIIINLKNNKIIGGHQRYEVLINQHMLNNDFYGELTGFDELETSFYTDNEELDFNPFDYEEEEEETPEDYADVEGERTNEQYVISISFPTQEEANEFLDFLEAPYKLTQRSVGIHSSEINWGDSE